ncbi:hypothetical protein [Lysobacter panacisoli]|uniref:Outer membrane protein beta-barrel domain-containing protein n=1 Tax=Lysobacter panacisoli TaxID=1255263 RepID=A0ABP9LDD7_9GAMM|nr:hypothetical protein [Lysobacter panacisoli]
MKTHRTAFVAMPLLAAFSLPCFAVEPLDTFSARVGLYVTDFDTEVRADGETSAGTRVDLERDLGLDSSNNIAFVGLTWRPFDHHEFGFSYYQDDADATRRINRDIEFNDTLYETSSTVRAALDLDAYEAYYVWWAASKENWALGPRFGLLWYSMSLELSLEVDANGNQIGGQVSEKIDADLPAPTIGGSWRWAPVDDWRFSADVGYFSADVDNIDADITFGRAGVEWFPWESTGISLDYTVRKIEADAERSSFLGNLDFVDSGIRLGVTYRF